ncbi:Anti-sigma-K factor RskA [Roseivivax lentus]|uniref:Anti-sigma-K factor RskA n=1 Tax=Roseivivax lentus TaxID=633194 RepID=A0A1N7LE95_9RHOB|nr:anti-sigma factor [Roseivivax lentus]SIS72159.1 Anti-sigma-K factor RskA [Roseivivax lentus]
MSGPQTDRPDGPGEDDALAAEYVLGLMSPEEVAAFEARLDVEPRLVARVVGWTEDFAALTESLPETAPAPQLKRRIEVLAFGDAPRRSWWRSLLPYALGAVAAAVFGWAVMISGFLVPDLPEPLYVADLEAAEGPPLLVHAGYIAETNELLIRRDAGLVPEGRDNELWLVPGEGAPISLGLVPRETGVISRRVLPPALVAALEGGTLAVSEEPAGGAPDGVPSDVRAIGPVLPFTET